MKSKITRFIVCVFSLALAWGVGGTCFADNAAEVVIQVTYPAIDEDVYFYNGLAADIDDFALEKNYYVNVHITLLDANGDPATAGPDGEDLSTLTAILTTELGTTGSIVEDEFLSDSATLNFDVVDVGPVARAHVGYACQNDVPSGNVCEPGTDTLEVTVGTLDPASAEVEVKAPPASSLAVRTPGLSDITPSDLFDEIPAPANNGGVAAQAGAAINFEVYAVEAVDGDFTTAPELDGVEVTVNAYADYDASDKVGDMSDDVEDTAVDTATAEFSGGVAAGTITITAAGTKDKDGNSRLKVVLTAATDSINTTKITATPDVATDTTVDCVGMMPTIKNQLIIGKDPSGIGNLIEGVDVWYVLDDNTTGPTTNNMVVFIADQYGNPVTNENADVVSAVSGPLVDLHFTLVDANGENGGTGTAWNVVAGTPGNVNPGLATVAGAGDNQQEATGGGGGSANRGKPLEAKLTLTSTNLTTDDATVWLVRTDKTNGTQDLDLRLDTDKPASVVTAGDTVTLYIMSASATSYEYPTTSEIVEYNDDLVIDVFECGTPANKLKISKSTQTIDQATDEGLELKAPTPTSGTKEIRIPIKIWGACTQAVDDSICVTLVDSTKGIGVDTAIPLFDASGRSITDLQPATESKVVITSLPVDAEGTAPWDDPDTDPIVITSDMRVGENTLLSANSVDTADAYGNIVNGAPDYLIDSTIGIAGNDATKAASVVYGADDVGQTDTIEVFVSGVGSRSLSIVNILESAAAGALICSLEGPLEPVPGGEAIIRIRADGTFTPTPRDVKVSIDADNSVEGSDIRDLTGVVLTIPTDLSTTQILDSGSMVRLAVSAPEAGDVVIEVGDASGETVLLDTGECTISFGAACTAVVSIDPDGAELLVGQTKQFNASTDCEEPDTEPETPCYTWEIMDTGTTGCTGSTIDNDGLYTAPESGDCTDTIKVTDTCNGDATDTAQVVVSDCTPTCAITPASAGPLETGDTQSFSAATTCGGTSREGTYTWSVAGGSADTLSGDTIVYTAGSTDGTYDVTAEDTTNGCTCTATVEISNEPEKSITISPDPMQKGSLIGLWNLMTIEGTNTNFAAFSTTVSFDPDAAIFELFPLILGPTNIWQLVQVNPTWIAGEGAQTVTVTVTTGAEVVTDTFEIEMLFGE